MFSALGRFHSENEHMLGQPALFAREVGTNSQRQTFLAEQNVSAVTGADRDDRVVLREVADKPAFRVDIE